MKKKLLILLCGIALFSITGCGNEKKSSNSYIGIWEYDTGKGNVITYHINKGGTGYYEQSTQSNTKWDFKWEIKDTTLVITREFLGTTFVDSFELNENDELECIDGDMEGPYIKKNVKNRS